MEEKNERLVTTDYLNLVLVEAPDFSVRVKEIPGQRVKCCRDLVTGEIQVKATHGGTALEFSASCSVGSTYAKETYNFILALSIVKTNIEICNDIFLSKRRELYNLTDVQIRCLLSSGGDTVEGHYRTLRYFEKCGLVQKGTRTLTKLGKVIRMDFQHEKELMGRLHTVIKTSDAALEYVELELEDDCIFLFTNECSQCGPFVSFTETDTCCVCGQKSHQIYDTLLRYIPIPEKKEKESFIKEKHNENSGEQLPILVVAGDGGVEKAPLLRRGRPPKKTADSEWDDEDDDWNDFVDDEDDNDEDDGPEENKKCPPLCLDDYSEDEEESIWN